ncbi:MAG TPA: integrase arm-type DNA-binding domain-containing protein [Geobacteraceae bacterium]
MSRTTKELSAKAVEGAKAVDKDLRLYDGKGLFLLVTTKGGKWWRFKYAFEGKAKTLSFGTYPEVSLADARECRDDARKLLAKGIDPGEVRRAQKESQTEDVATFEVIGREWFHKNERFWSPGHAKTVKGRLERDVFPAIGPRSIVEIKAPELLAMLHKIEARGNFETAYRIKVICGQVFRYAAQTGRTESDPTPMLKGSLAKRQEKHHAAITDPRGLARLLRDIDEYEGSFIVKCALQLAPMVFVRPGELQKAEWSEFNFDTAEWNIPPNRMKMKQAHLVPLSKQALGVLKALHAVTGEGKYVFPNYRTTSRPMSDVAMLAALRSMGYDKDTMTTHGFRATARTLMEEVLNERYELIEHQLAHTVRDANGRAYNRTTHLQARREMMQRWSDYLDSIKAMAKVIPISKAV